MNCACGRRIGTAAVPLDSPTQHSDWFGFQHLRPSSCCFHRHSISRGAEHCRSYDTTTGQPVCPPLEHPEAVLGIRFHTSGSSVLTSCNDGYCEPGRSRSGKTIGDPMRFPYALGCIATNFNRELLAVRCADKIHIVYVPETVSSDNPARTRRGSTGWRFIQSRAAGQCWRRWNCADLEWTTSEVIG